MEKIEKTTLTIIAALTATTILSFAAGCGSESPAAAPTEVAVSPTPSPVAVPTAAAESPTAPIPEAAQVSTDPDGAQTPADAPDLADFMDEEATRLFEEMTPDSQGMVRSAWDEIRATAPREAWMDVMGQMIAQLHASAKIHGEIRGVEVEGVQDIVDPSKGPGPDQSATASPPFVLGLLPPKYQEAYELIPEGSLMREYMDRRLGSFSQEGWEAANREPNEPYSTPVPELDPGEEFELTRMIRTAGGEEWFIQRLQAIDVDAAREFQAAAEIDERLEVLRQLVEIDGKEDAVMELQAEWGARSAGFTEDQVADFVQRYRDMAADFAARIRMTATQGYLNGAESFICGDLMNHIVGEDFRTAVSGPAQCDIDKVIALTRAALDEGRAATSEEDFREAIDHYEETGQWTFSVTWNGPEGE